MENKNKFCATIEKIIQLHIFALPVVIFFSYHPRILLADTGSMNIELSLPFIWLLTFVFANFIYIFQQKKQNIFFSKKYFQNFFSKENFFLKFFSKKNKIFQKLFFIATLFLIYSFISIFWSANFFRAVLTFTLMLFIYFSLFFLHCHREFILGNQAKLLKILFNTTSVICIICIIQAFADSVGVPRAQSLMCAGCVHSYFGFPRVTGLAIEPQFMGNLLLLPVLLSIYLLVNQNNKSSQPKIKLTTLITANFLSTTTLFLTLSRGAIFSYGIGIIILVIMRLHKHVLDSIKVIILGFMALCLCLCAQVGFAKISNSPEKPIDIIARSIHQLSLGKIDLRRSPYQLQNPTQLKHLLESNPDQPALSKQTTTQPVANLPHFSGYVAESTNIRLNFTKVALKTWVSSSQNFIFGVGLGGAGTAMYSQDQGLGSTKEIVQNQFVEVLLELGIIGFGIVAAFFIQIFLYFLSTRKTQDHSFTLIMMAAYTVSLVFFSGLPNALHIYLLPEYYLFISNKIQRHRHN